MEDVGDRRALPERAATVGGALALESFRDDLAVETKRGPLDAVTAVDRAVERRVTEVIREVAPGEPVVGEEAPDAERLPSSGPAWVVDPIDGTNNYVRGIRVWATSVTLVRDGAPVAACNVLPALGDRYVTAGDGVTRNDDPVSVSDRSPAAATVGTVFGTRPPHQRGLRRTVRAVVEHLGDVRRFGSGQAALSMVASGELDAAVSTGRLHPWDSLAGVALVRAAGGTVTDLEGEPWRHGATGLVASNGVVHEPLLAALGSSEE